MSSDSPSLFPRDAGPTIVQLMGPSFIGLILNYFLWGIQVTQSYHYYKSYRKTDNKWCKLTVGLLFIMDIVQSVCATFTAWGFMVEKWGDIDRITLTPDWGIWMMPLTDSFTASIVHAFYAHKIWVLLDAPYNYIFTSIVMLLSCLQLTAGFGCSIFQALVRMTLSEFNRIDTWVAIWLTGASATDMIITAVMSKKLSGSRTGFQETDDFISKLVRLTVETGLATAVVQIVDAVIFLVWPLKPFHTVPTLIAPKLYSNSVLAVLNSRPPRKSVGNSESLHSKMANNVAVVQTISISNDYELRDVKHGRRSPRSQSQKGGLSGGEGSDESPFTHKDEHSV